MRVVVFGAGAIGSWVGALLSFENEVFLVARRDHVEAVERGGLHVEGRTEVVARPHVTTDIRRVPFSPDVIFVTVKSYDTAEAAREISGVVREGTIVVSLQNGLGNLEELSHHVPSPSLVGGVTTHGVTWVAPGRVRHTGVGRTVVGAWGGNKEGAWVISSLLSKAGIPTEVSDRIRSEIWGKVLINAAINPVTAITGLRNGALLENELLGALAQEAASEGACVARAEGVEIPFDDPGEEAMEVARRTRENKSSMLQDVERGKRTEIDSINGELVRRGKKHGVPTPVNFALHALVKGIEETTRR